MSYYMSLAPSFNHAKLQPALFFTDVDKKMKNVTNTCGLAHAEVGESELLSITQSIKSVVTCGPLDRPWAFWGCLMAFEGTWLLCPEITEGGPDFSEPLEVRTFKMRTDIEGQR